MGHGCCDGLPVPREKFVDAMSGMAGDTGEDIREPGLRVDVIHLGRGDEAIHGGGALTATVRTAEQPRFAVMQRSA